MSEFLHIDDHLKDNLSGLQFSPQVGSFDLIMKKLEKKRKKRFFFILSLVGVLFFLSLPALFFIGSETPQTVSETNLISVPPPVVKNRAESLTVNELQKRSTISPGKQLHDRLTTIGSADPIVTSSSAGHEKTRPLVTARLSAASETRSLDEKQEAEKSLSGEIIHEPNEPFFLPLLFKDLPVDTSTKPISTEPIVLSSSLQNLLNNKGPQFFIGVFYQPQVGMLLLNAQSESELAQNYLQHRKEINSPKFNQVFGVRAGIILKSRWELSLGLHSRKVVFQDGDYAAPILNPVSPSSSKNDIRQQETELTYNDLAFELARHGNLGRFLRIKIGGGVALSILSSKTNAVAYEDFFPPLCMLNLKAGLVENIGRLFQIQLCPTVYSSLNNMYGKTHPLYARNAGVGLDAALLYKFK